MTRGDLRTLVVITCTAIASSVATVVVTHIIEAPRECSMRLVTVETPPPPPALPVSLDSYAIINGFALINPEIAACGRPSARRGQTELSVHVLPDGSVSSVTVWATPDPAVAKCVSEAVSTTRFARTRDGAHFQHVLTF